MNFIYSLTIDETPFYIGKTANLKQRYREHKSRCFGETRREYKLKLYQFIRSKGISKETFYENVKINVIYENVPDYFIAIMEDFTINSYGNKFEIQNSQQGISYTFCVHDKNRLDCKLCDGYSICEHDRIRRHQRSKKCISKKEV